MRHQFGAVPGDNTVGLDDSSDESSQSQNEDEYLISQRPIPETEGWNVFRDPPAKIDSGSEADQSWLMMTLKIIKVIVYLVVFLVVLASSVVAIGTTLFMTSQIRVDRTVLYCNQRLGTAKTFVVTLPEAERISWIWCIILAFMIPEIGTLIRSIRICCFKTWMRPSIYHVGFVAIMETFHVVGLAIIFMGILPDLNVVQGAMLTNAVCFVPGVLSLLSRVKKCDQSKEYLFMLLDSAAVAAQMSAFVVWPFLYGSNWTVGLLPLALIMVSFGWWENYVPVENTTCLMSSLSRVKEGLQSTRYSTYVFVSVWKIIAFILSSMAIFHMKGETVTNLFTMFGSVFSDRNITVSEVQSIVGGGTIPDLSNVLSDGVTAKMIASYATPIYVLMIQVLSAYFAYIFGKFACKVLIQGFSYALPVNLAIPVSISLLIAACALRNADPCAFSGTIPDYLFFESSNLSNLGDFILEEYAWVWLLWLLSQMWITVHICTPKCEVLAPTEKLFVTPMYNGLLINQSMGMNRNREDEPEISKEGPTKMEKDKDDSDDDISDEDSLKQRPVIRKSDRVTKIYACATMWREKKNEMLGFLKSILRMDHDQCARKIAQKFLKMPVLDYYEFETHIFFDDAFEVPEHDENESQVNEFVRQLVDVLDEAASEVHRTRIRVRAPKKCPTPYGGRLIWTLPGNTKMIVHLKDTSVIRHRKRWSQVMYMYYLLGYRIMDLPISILRKEAIAENTYLLTLDGDIDFQPSAVMRLVDLMKKNPNLGAACGRIHPIGSGPMVWYQRFEYGIGHWLQKATEHVIGCVLCSPGCFSMFRAKALMDDNVMKKYTTPSTEARHYVQYDQGEDRWLCTLLLQRGYRVEYSAASDAYTHAPETFYDFFIQRRRWISSTMANIMDLIMHSKRTVKNNDDISTLYMCYQVMLMVGTILGPGTIFLMLIGAFVAAFQIGMMTSFYYNIVPVLLFIIVCFTCKTDVQISVAAVISVIYGLVMMAVIVGIVIQMAEDGWVAPSSLFLFLIVGQLVIAGLMHPQELGCLPCGLIYYVTIPSMYLLLVIYCVINLNIVTWGTRESTTKKTLAELEEERKELEEAKEKSKNKSFLNVLKNGQNNDGRGSLEFSFAGLFKCMLCTHGKPSDENIRLIAIADGFEQVLSQLDTLNSRLNDPQGSSPAWKRTPRVVSRFVQEPMNHIEEDPVDDDEDSDSSTRLSQIHETNRKRNYLINPYWLDGEGLKKGEPDYLKAREENFWTKLIESYLYPIDDNKVEKKRIADDLKKLRNNCALAFFMLNAIFVVIIFLMQLNQDLLHIVWPLGAQNTVAFDQSALEVHIAMEYLHLEPIGLLFVVFFGIILVIQFIAMLFHRLGTFGHIIASTKLQWTYCCKTPEDLSQEDLIKRDAVEIVKGFQRMDSIEANYGKISDAVPARRKTIRNLEKSRERTQNVDVNLVDIFHKRYSMSESSGFKASVPRTSTKALNAFTARRSTVKFERRNSRLTAMGENHVHEMGRISASQQPGTSRDGQIYFHDNFTRNLSGVDNNAYEFEESLTDAVDDRRVSFQTPR